MHYHPPRTRHGGENTYVDFCSPSIVFRRGVILPNGLLDRRG